MERAIGFLNLVEKSSQRLCNPCFINTAHVIGMNIGVLHRFSLGSVNGPKPQNTNVFFRNWALDFGEACKAFAACDIAYRGSVKIA